MIRIKFREPETAAWKRWVKDCEKATAKLRDDYEAGNTIEITELYKRKSIKKEVYFSKTGPFRGRCAYCESYIADLQRGDVEHFRPKRAVTDENDVPVTITRPGGRQEQHPGYFWLAYNWKNLLPSCTSCNQPGDEGIGKRNRFPLEPPPGHGITDTDITTERPLLINPADPDDDDPENHLDIELETGIMCSRNNSRRGEACVKIFGLNIRDQLVNGRRAAMEEVTANYLKLLTVDDAKARIVRDQLKEMEQGSLSYTLARRAQIRKTKERLGIK